VGLHLPGVTRYRQARPLIGLLPVLNQTGETALDPLAHRITDRLFQGLAEAMFADAVGICWRPLASGR
jgi:hypothetical protein